MVIRRYDISTTENGSAPTRKDNACFRSFILVHAKIYSQRTCKRELSTTMSSFSPAKPDNSVVLKQKETLKMKQDFDIL